jgi:nucleoside-diphosphate-sugar epimerase
VKILLTGATGFIGSTFARIALARGHSVAGIVLPTEKIPAPLTEAAHFTAIRGSLQSLPWNEVEAFHPETCVHAAWITTPGIYLESPENYKFLEHSVEFLRQTRERGTKHIVALGTCIEYRITHAALSEEHTQVDPTTVYSRCKNELRLKLEAEATRDAFRLCWARVFYPYGPGEHPSRLCSSILAKLTREEKVVLKTPQSTKDYIFIEDLADALLTVTEKRFEGTINLGTGVGVSVREIAGRLSAMLGREHLVEEASETAVDPLGYVVADASRIHGLGWKPSHTIEQGLRKLVASQNSAASRG